MKILIVTQYFWPENFRVNDLALALLERGHDVTVLTGVPNYPGGRFFPGYGFIRPSCEDYEGVRVLRVPLIPRGNGRRVRLILNYASYAVVASLLGPARCRDLEFDIVFVFEPSPITVALPAIVMKRRRRIPMILWVLDLWPETLTSAGGLSNPLVIGATGRLVRRIYRHCDLILAQSRSFIPSICDHGVDAATVRYFPSWAESIFSHTNMSNVDRRLVQLPSGFRLMFAGNIGASQDFPTILDAAERLKDDHRIHWLIVGDGRMRPWVEEEAARRGIGHTVHLLGAYPLEDMPWFFTQADAMLVTLKKDPTFAATIPGKLQSYLAFGKPIVAALSGEGAQVVEEARGGIVCSPGDAEGLALAVSRMSSLPESTRKQMGLNGLAYYQANFERSKLLDRLEQWMEELVSQNTQARN